MTTACPIGILEFSSNVSISYVTYTRSVCASLLANDYLTWFWGINWSWTVFFLSLSCPLNSLPGLISLLIKEFFDVGQFTTLNLWWVAILRCPYGREKICDMLMLVIRSFYGENQGCSMLVRGCEQSWVVICPKRLFCAWIMRFLVPADLGLWGLIYTDEMR